MKANKPLLYIYINNHNHTSPQSFKMLHVLLALLHVYNLCTPDTRVWERLFGGYGVCSDIDEDDAKVADQEAAGVRRFVEEQTALIAAHLKKVGLTLMTLELSSFTEAAVKQHFDIIREMVWSAFLAKREEARPELEAWLAEVEKWMAEMAAYSKKRTAQLSRSYEGLRKLAAISGHDHGDADVLKYREHCERVKSVLSYKASVITF